MNLKIRCPKCRTIALDQPITPDSAWRPTFVVNCTGCPTRYVSTIKPDWTHVEFLDLATDNGRVVRIATKPKTRSSTPPKPPPLPLARRTLERAGAL